MIELRFGNSNMKKSYLAEAKLRKEKLVDCLEICVNLQKICTGARNNLIQQNSIRSCIDACGESNECPRVYKAN